MKKRRRGLKINQSLMLLGALVAIVAMILIAVEYYPSSDPDYEMRVPTARP